MGNDQTKRNQKGTALYYRQLSDIASSWIFAHYL